MIFLVQKLKRPFSLYVLFSQRSRSCDNNFGGLFLSNFPSFTCICKHNYEKKRVKFHRSFIGKTKHISRDKKCNSLNRVSSGKEKKSSDQLSTKSAHPASKMLSVARLVLYKETQCTPLVACHVYLSRLFSHLVRKH